MVHCTVYCILNCKEVSFGCPKVGIVVHGGPGRKEGVRSLTYKTGNNCTSIVLHNGPRNKVLTVFVKLETGRGLFPKGLASNRKASKRIHL